MVHALRAQMQNVETGFTSRMDFIVARYALTNNGLPSNNRLCSQGNEFKVSSI
jgi:hypothetical protein